MLNQAVINRFIDLDRERSDISDELEIRLEQILRKIYKLAPEVLNTFANIDNCSVDFVDANVVHCEWVTEYRYNDRDTGTIEIPIACLWDESAVDSFIKSEKERIAKEKAEESLNEINRKNQQEYNLYLSLKMKYDNNQ